VAKCVVDFFWEGRRLMHIRLSLLHPSSRY